MALSYGETIARNYDLQSQKEQSSRQLAFYQKGSQQKSSKPKLVQVRFRVNKRWRLAVQEYIAALA